MILACQPNRQIVFVTVRNPFKCVVRFELVIGVAHVSADKVVVPFLLVSGFRVGEVDVEIEPGIVRRLVLIRNQPGSI